MQSMTCSLTNQTKLREEVQNKLTELCKSCEQTKQPNTTGKRKRDQKGINKPPAVPISHPTLHINTHQNKPNSGSKGEECPEMEHERSKVGLVPKKFEAKQEQIEMIMPGLRA
eukprot:9795521-Ditylum_brightwellii.AAC.1